MVVDTRGVREGYCQYLSTKTYRKLPGRRLPGKIIKLAVLEMLSIVLVGQARHDIVSSFLKICFLDLFYARNKLLIFF